MVCCGDSPLTILMDGAHPMWMGCMISIKAIRRGWMGSLRKSGNYKGDGLASAARRQLIIIKEKRHEIKGWIEKTQKQ